MKRPRDDRRRFLGACLALSLAPAATGCPLESGGTPTQRWRLVHLRHEVAEIGDSGTYLRLRASLAGHALNPWLRSWMEALDDEQPSRFEALVEAEHNPGGIKFGTLLDFSESFELEPDTPALSFVDWLPHFHPKSRDDFLMALPLYQLYRNAGTILPVIQSTPDPWLDAMLESTRGMLFWRQQYVEFVRICGGINHCRAAQLIQDYVRRLPGAVSALEKIAYAATGQNMMQIIKERSPEMGPHSTPDYLAADWLSRHWAAWPMRAISSNQLNPIESLADLAKRA